MDPGLRAVGLDARFPGWIEHLKARGYSPKSIAIYSGNMAQFLTWCRYKRQEVNLVDWEFIEGWIRHLQDAKRAPTTINSKLQALGAFYDYLLRRGDVPKNPKHDVRQVKVPRRLPRFLSEEEAMKILGAAPTPMARALLETLYGCGLRRAELCGLNMTDVLWPQAVIRVIGKGRKERIVPVPLPCLEALKAWLPERKRLIERAKNPSREALFINSRSGVRIGRGGVVSTIEWAARLAGHTGKIHPHLFRHTYATHLYNRGADIRAIQVLMGHEHVQTTEIYTHVSDRRLNETIRQFHPRA